jgi:pyridoxal phosphate enzyme (YggS family)
MEESAALAKSPDEFSAASLSENYRSVTMAIANAIRAAPGHPSRTVQLVAVSKTKPHNTIQHLYDVENCRVFGENYVQEIVEKAAVLPADIQWHFIGHLQSNKALVLVRDVHSLAVVETVDSESLARKLNAAVAAHRPDRILNVFVQVNTSGEESKSGVDPGAQVLALSRLIHEQCPLLKLSGLMTIGAPDYTCTDRDFGCLRECRTMVAKELHLDESELELSMGMSSDFEAAIVAGSTTVRVGSHIFGARQRKN